jgi:crotonobetainyl-CoA:carnitine CoA-transferase CaiB-like acyl-CoA transferase
MSKLGVTLNLETTTGKKIFGELLKNADVFVMNYPLKRIKELSLTYEYVKQINTRIVMTCITPFGLTGPYKDYKGGELVNTHLGGVGYLSTREGDVSKEPLKYPAHLFSFQAGLSAAAATLGSVYRQRVSGEGMLLDASEQESVIQNLNAAIARYSYTKQISRRTDVLNMAPHHILPCKDGYIYASFVQEHQWRRFVDVMGHPDWADSELFANAEIRSQYWDALKPLMLEWMMQHTVEEIYRWSQEKGIPLGAVRTADQVLKDKQMLAREFFVDVEREDTGKLTYPGVPYRFSGIQREAPAAAPFLGQHNEEIYCKRMTYTKQDLIKLNETGVI